MFIAERYEIIEKIGSGGMSNVYKAKCHKLNRLVAIKILKPEYSEDKVFVTKFRAEAQSAAGLMHANIVNVYDVGEEDGIYYIVMELVEGITLKKYIEKKGRLGIKEAVSVAIQIAQGIEAAHNHHIIHRDIKPQNIIISKEGKVKVTDFGIAKATSSNTINSSVMGSVHYISPEQARGGYCDEKSDIYSFGITLYEMLTGRVPFEGENTVAIALQHIQDDMITPKTYVPELPISVEKIVLKCTQKKIERRYQSVTELIADLKRSLVTPDEDFVVMVEPVISDSPTMMFNHDEMEEISSRAAVKKADDIDVINPMRDGNIEEAVDTEYPPRAPKEEYDKGDDLDDDEIDDGYEEDTSHEKSDKKIDKVITILGIALAVVIVIITVVIITKMTSTFGGKKTTAGNTQTGESIENGVKVPSVVGKTFEDAKAELNRVGLGIKKEEDFSEIYEAGLVFKQSEEADSVVEENSTIIVTVSKGVEGFPVPNVAGKEYAEAQTILSDKGLVVETEYVEATDDTLIGRVKTTNPAAGSTISKGSTITLQVYKGNEQIMKTVPDLKGKTLEQAKQIIASSGFKLGKVDKANDDKIPEGSVISQSGVKVGEQAVEGSEINLVISEGVKTSGIPNICGFDLATAKSALEAQGFKLGVATEEYSDSIKKGVIFDQSIPASTIKDPGTMVDVKVSKGPKPNEPTTPQAPSTPAAPTTPVAPTTPAATIVKSAKLEIPLTKVQEAIDMDALKKDSSIKVVYVLKYKDVNGNESSKTIASVPKNTWGDLEVSAPFNLDPVQLTDAAAQDAKVDITVTYVKTDGTSGNGTVSVPCKIA